MRQLPVQVPQGCGKTVLEIANACDGTNLARFGAAGVDRSLDLTQAIQAHLLAQGFNAMPLVNVIVLETPPEP